MAFIGFHKMKKDVDGTKLVSSASDTSSMLPIVFDPETDASFLPSDDWSPAVESRLETSGSPSRMDNILRIAHIAKQGIDYHHERPILVESGDGTIIVRFPANTNAPSGYRYRGPTWVATVTLDAKTLQVISVLEDAN